MWDDNDQAITTRATRADINLTGMISLEITSHVLSVDSRDSPK